MRKAKKFTAILLMMEVVCLGAVGCGGKKRETKETIYEDEYGNSVFEEEGGEHVLVDSIPYGGIEYHGSKFSIDDIQLGQEKTEHGYVPVVAINFDMSNLSEDEIYWIEKDFGTNPSGGFNVRVSISEEKNNINYKPMRLLNEQFGTGSSFVVFCTYDEYRYDLYGMSIDVMIETEQDEAYSYEYDGLKKTRNKINRYSFTVNGDGNISEEVLDMD